MWLLPLLFFAQAAPADSPHLDKNPVYQELRKSGISVTQAKSFPIQEPYLADGLDQAAQRKLIEKLGGRKYRFEELTRNTTVAPQILEIKEEKVPDGDTKARIVHVYFVAYGDLEALAKGGKVGQPDSDADKQWKPLAAEDLAGKNVKIDDPNRESYGYFMNDLIDQVRLSGVLRTYWSQTEESLIAAAMLDPRFDDDPDYPNRWQPLTGRGNNLKAGEASPYHGAGGYTKITKLKSPIGALFIESHLIFAEPHGWFDGQNLLGSKLPAVLQHEVRTGRADIKKATTDAK